jgi:hypothetical protein
MGVFELDVGEELEEDVDSCRVEEVQRLFGRLRGFCVVEEESVDS